MSQLIFYISFTCLLFYLTIDIFVVNEDGTSRPIVQLVAGIALLSMLVYNLINIKRLKKIFRKWSFLFYWGLFVVLIIGYYVLSLVNLPTGYANSLVRNAFVAIFIFNAILFVYNATITLRLKDITLWVLVTLLIANALFDLGQAIINPTIRPGGIEEVNTSSGYVFVMILPLLMYLFRKEYIWIYSLTFMLTILTGKRGAILIYIILSLFFLVHYGAIKRQRKLNWRAFLFIGFMLISFAIFYEIALESFLFRLSTFQKESGAIGSGRNIIWLTLLSHWLDSHLVFKLIGSGFYSTINIMGFVAHNDIVQYLVDLGVIGLSFWLFILYKFYDDIKFIKTQDNYMYMLLVFCLIILIGRGLFSGALRTDSIYLSVSIGYLLGTYQLNFGRVFIKFKQYSISNDK